VAANASPVPQLAWFTLPASQALLAVASQLPVQDRRLALRLSLDPGGTHTVQVQLDHQQGPLSAWHTGVEVEHDRVTSLVMWAAKTLTR
jgi:hypothetical protein